MFLPNATDIRAVLSDKRICPEERNVPVLFLFFFASHHIPVTSFYHLFSFFLSSFLVPFRSHAIELSRLSPIPESFFRLSAHKTGANALLLDVHVYRTGDPWVLWEILKFPEAMYHDTSRTQGLYSSPGGIWLRMEKQLGLLVLLHT